MAIGNPTFFRGTILLAAMHYHWVTGSFGPIEQTYLYHRGEALKSLSNIISDTGANEQCASLMAAMALAEVSVLPTLLDGY